MADLKKTKILIIGAGGIGERHLRCFQATGRADVSFCEPNDDRRQMLRLLLIGAEGHDHRRDHHRAEGHHPWCAGQRAFLFPHVFAAAKAAGRVPADLIDTCVDPACFELAGHMVFKRGADFDAPADAALALVWRLLAAATPDEAAFEAIVDLALGL